MGVFNCLHPRTITNSRGDILRVRCGKCEVCTCQKSQSYATQCKLESDAHNYTLFVTLTYANEFLPLARYFYNDGLFFYNSTSRLEKYARCSDSFPFLGTAHSSELSCRDLSMYFYKFALPPSMDGCIPFLCKIDVQLFLKRLRYYIIKETNEKIRYFACGEYGPVHFRPHYHFLLWFDKAETASIVGKAIRKAWHYGRVDYSFSKGKVASYVSQYSNSLSSRSRLHSLRCFRPFVLHSAHLFGSFYQDEIEDIKSVEYDRIARKVFNDNGRLREVAPLLAFEHQLFPRCYNFSETSHDDHLVCYQFLRRAQKEYGCLPIKHLANIIYNDEDGGCYTMLQRLSFNSKFMESTVSSVLYTSFKFFKLCHTYRLYPDDLVRLIEDYYSRKDYYNLCQQLLAEDEFIRSVDGDDRFFLLYFFDNFSIDTSDDIRHYPKVFNDYIVSLGLEPQFVTKQLFSLEQNPLFLQFQAFYKKLSNDMVKHKYLNDLNKIFVY